MEHEQEMNLKIELLLASKALNALSLTGHAVVNNEVLGSVENFLKERNASYAINRRGRAYSDVTITTG